MKNSFCKKVSIFFVLLIGLALTACGDKEPERRAAFIAFLNDTVVNAASIKLDELDRDKKKAFGNYADHYALLVRFQKAAAETTAKNARDLLSLAEFDSLAAIAKAERSLRKASGEAVKLRKALLELKEKTDAARAKLKQPEDLARVYDAAYQKVVAAPAAASVKTFEAVGETFAATLDLVDFVHSHSKDMEIDGTNINVKNPGLLDDLNAKMAALRGKADVLQKAYEAMTKAMR